MSRTRKYGEDLTYGEEHRHRFPELYERIGHRIAMADRDWTEFCYHCKEPLGLYEEVRDKGQNLNDKATTITRKLGQMSGLPAFLFAWKVERPAEVDAEIFNLNQRIRKLEEAYPIVGFTSRRLTPKLGPLIAMTPEEWWKHILALHRDHHRNCSAATRREEPVRVEPLEDYQNGNPLWTPGDQLSMDNQLKGVAA